MTKQCKSRDGVLKICFCNVGCGAFFVSFPFEYGWTARDGILCSLLEPVRCTQIYIRLHDGMSKAACIFCCLVVLLGSAWTSNCAYIITVWFFGLATLSKMTNFAFMASCISFVMGGNRLLALSMFFGLTLLFCRGENSVPCATILGKSISAQCTRSGLHDIFLMSAWAHIELFGRDSQGRRCSRIYRCIWRRFVDSAVPYENLLEQMRCRIFRRRRKRQLLRH